MFYILIFFAVVYALLIFLYANGFNKHPNYYPSSKFPVDIPISILIPTRNPDQRILALIQQLQHQLTHTTQKEILVLDDFSTITIPHQDHQNYKIISLSQHRPELNNSKNNKKEAIALGVEHAHYEYILCLDSDVSLPEKWWFCISNFIHDYQPKFAAGLHMYARSRGGFNEFLVLEQAVLTASSLAALFYQIPTMCNGANMLFSKQAFNQVQGYDGLYHTHGGDDLFLYHRMFENFPKETLYIKCMEASVSSYAPNSLKDLLTQRERWLSKTPYYEHSWIHIQAGIILICNILCVFTLFHYSHWFFLVGKAGVDLLFLLTIQKFYVLHIPLHRKLIFILCYPFYVTLVFLKTLFNGRFLIKLLTL